jgi:hypothetical protein
MIDGEATKTITITGQESDAPRDLSGRIWPPAAEQRLRDEARDLRAAADAIDALIMGDAGPMNRLASPPPPFVGCQVARRQQQIYGELARLICPRRPSFRAWAADVAMAVRRRKRSTRPPRDPISRLAQGALDAGEPLSESQLRKLLPQLLDHPNKYWPKKP